MIRWLDEHLEMRAALRRFVETEVEPRRMELEFGDLPPYAVLRSFYAAFGLDQLALERFERHRGGGRQPKRDAVELGAVLLPLVEFSRCSPGLVTALGVSTNLAGGSIMRGGTDGQRDRWARDLLTLDKVGAWALTEPGSGSDAFGAMLSCARPAGEEYILNGSKTFITNGPYADTVVFVCKLDDGRTPRARQPVVSFIVEPGMAGVSVSRPLRKMGLHSSPTGEVTLQDVRVGRDRLLGGKEPSSNPERTKGSGAGGVFTAERASMAAIALGIIEKSLELSVAYARDRVQFGRPIASFQLIQEKLAQMEIARMNVENMLLRYIGLRAGGERVSLGQASAMKLYAASAATAVTRDAMQIFGGNGYMSENRVEQLHRDASVLPIYAGTDQMQILAVAKDLVGPIPDAQIHQK